MARPRPRCSTQDYGESMCRLRQTFMSLQATTTVPKNMPVCSTCPVPVHVPGTRYQVRLHLRRHPHPSALSALAEATHLIPVPCTWCVQYLYQVHTTQTISQTPKHKQLPSYIRFLIHHIYVMAPRHNIIHPPPSVQDLERMRRPGLEAVPLVKKCINRKGQEYHPVFLPFDARVICPWCLKESAITTYPAHMTGDRECQEAKRLKKQDRDDQYLPPLEDGTNMFKPKPSGSIPPQNPNDLMAAFSQFLLLQQQQQQQQQQKVPADEEKKRKKVSKKSVKKRKKHSTSYHSSLSASSSSSSLSSKTVSSTKPSPVLRLDDNSSDSSTTGSVQQPPKRNNAANKLRKTPVAKSPARPEPLNAKETSSKPPAATAKTTAKTRTVPPKKTAKRTRASKASPPAKASKGARTVTGKRVTEGKHFIYDIHDSHIYDI